MGIRQRAVNVAFGIGVAFTFFAIVEGVLCAVGFEFDTVPHQVDLFGDGALNSENRHGEVIQRHPSFLWALVPGGTLGNFKVNDAGFIGAMTTLVPREGIYRIACIGDSNVALGAEPYPQKLQRILDARMPGRFEVINAGVPGYSSIQGLRLLEGRVLPYAPNLITVQYGWNDHWMTDKVMSQRLARPPVAFALRDKLRTLRLYQLGLFGFAHLSRASTPKDDFHYNVPPEEYREYLTQMVALGAKHGFRVALLTVPSNFKLGNLAPFERVGFRPDHPNPQGRPEGLLAVHAALNDIVREVAARQGAILVDLDARFADLKDRDEYFIPDAIHVSERGRDLIADMLVEAAVKDGAAAVSRPVLRDDHNGAGRYVIADSRVALKNFWPMVPNPREREGFQADVRSDSEIVIVGLSRASYVVELQFAREAAGSTMFVSQDDHPRQQVEIDSNGRVALQEPCFPDAEGVLRLRLGHSMPRSESSSDGAKTPDGDRGPPLIAVQLRE